MKADSRSLVLLVIMLVAIPLGLAVIFLFRQPAEAVRAQPDDSGKAKERVAYFETVKDREPSDVTVVPGGPAEIDLQSDGSGVEVIPIGAFRQTGRRANSMYHNPLSGYIRNVNPNPSGIVCVSAPTYPPDGATLTGFSATFRDDDATFDIEVKLYRVSNTNSVINGAEELALADAPDRDDSAVFEAMAPSIAAGKETVSKDYSYYAYTCLSPIPNPDDATLLLYGARVFYTP